MFRNEDISIFYKFLLLIEKEHRYSKLHYLSRFSSTRLTILLQILFLITLHEYQISLQSTIIQNDVPYIPSVNKNGVDFAFYNGQPWCCTYEDPKK